MSEQIQISVDADSEISDSVKLKVGFLERAVQRAKDQNCRLVQKMQKIEGQNQNLKQQKKVFDDSLNRLTQQLKKKDKQIEGLMQKLEVRTRRHQSELSQNISRTEKEDIERKIRRAEENATICKMQSQTQFEKYSQLMYQLESQKRQKAGLQAKIEYLQNQIIKDAQQITELDALYQQKMIILQKQKIEMAKQNESLSLQLKLFERKKQIQGLLDYQNKIGKDNPDLPTYRTNGRSMLCQQGEYECCSQLQQQLLQAEQLINLLKQRNSRLSSQVQAVKKRCSVLQGIICSSP